MRGDINRRSLRWSQQRWLLDTVVETIGIEWDQARLAHYAAPAGAAAGAVFRAAGARIKKFSDAHREFAAAGRQIRERAEGYEEEGRLVPARESFLTASLLWLQHGGPFMKLMTGIVSMKRK